MPTKEQKEEVKAAAARYQADKSGVSVPEYDDECVFQKRGHLSCVLEWSRERQRDILKLAEAYLAGTHQPVNTNLLMACEKAIASNGFYCVERQRLVNAIDTARAQARDDAMSIDDEWLKSIGFASTFTPASDESHLALVVFSDRGTWSDGDVLLVYSNDGSYGFWERPIDEHGDWHAFHNNFKRLRTRGDVLDLLRVIGVEPKATT